MIQRMLLVSLFVITNLLGAWSLPSQQIQTTLARAAHIPESDHTNQSAQPQVSTLTLADLGYTRDETLQGISATRSYAIDWPNAWEVGTGNEFTIEFSHSPALMDYSSLAVDWNGVRLGSTLLTPQNVERGSLTVSLPDSDIETGYNQLRIVLFMGIEDDRCQDPDNPAIWATIHSSSFFDLAYSEVSPEADLGLFPAPIIDESGLIDNSLLFVLPDEPTPGELNAVAMIAAKLGQLAAWRTLELDTSQESALADLEAEPGDRMFIGEAGRLAFLQTNDLPFVQANGGSVQLATENGQPIDAGAGVIWIQPGEDPRYVDMVVTGADETALLKAARALASSAVYPRLQGALGVVLEVPSVPAEATAFRQELTFAELGYPDETASGTRLQTLNFIMPLQMQWQVLTEGTLDLHFAHSKLLHNEQSSLTVAVNGSPVGSVLLTEDNADDARSTFVVPARLLRIGENQISVTTNIRLLDGYENNDELCDEEYLTEAWVVVYSDTQFNLPGGPAAMSLSLRDYPFAFIGRPDLADLAFVVPDQPSEEVVDGLASIAAQIGRSAEGDTLNPRVVPASQAGSIDAGLYQVIIGRPSENAAISSLNDLLPLPFEQGTDTPQASTEVAQISSPDGSVGFIEAVMGADGKPRLVATGANRQGVAWAANALSQPELMAQLEGDLAILDSDVRMLTATINKPSASVETVPAETAQPAATSWMLWLAGGIFLVAVLILIMVIGSELINRRKVRKNYESPTL